MREREEREAIPEEQNTHPVKHAEREVRARDGWERDEEMEGGRKREEREGGERLADLQRHGLTSERIRDRETEKRDRHRECIVLV